MIDKHRSLIKDRNDLAASSQDASRLLARGQKGEKRDPTRLLREEKMRKRIAKDLPKIESDLQTILENWEEEYGRPFLVHGQRYLDELEATSAKVAPPRSKTPNNPIPGAQPKSTKTIRPASRSATVRGPPPRSHTPTGTRNPFSASVRGTPATAHANFAASVSGFSGLGTTRSATKASPTKLPARAPLGTMHHGNNSPERRPRAVINGSSAEDFKGSVRGLMGPPRAPLARTNVLKDMSAPLTPTPISHADISERSASIVRHVDLEDVYDDNNPPRSAHNYQSYSTNYSYSRPASQMSQISRPGSRFDYPSAPPPPPLTRQTSNTSSVMSSNSAVSGSENWETYTDASGDYEPEPDARDAYYAKIRATKRGSPDDDYRGANQTLGTGNNRKGYGLGIGGPGVRAVGHPQDSSIMQVGGAEGSEAGWTDCGETF